MLILFATVFKYDTLVFDNEEFLDHCTINTKDHKHDMYEIGFTLLQINLHSLSIPELHFLGARNVRLDNYTVH